MFSLFLTLLLPFSVLGSNLDWWKNAVFYQIYPRSFMDLNNDGIGDLKGITSKLDHLVEIGVTALWLSPIYRSPQVDHGYDISDYRDVDPIFGNLDDFKVLLKTAKQKGDQHEWFKKSENSEPGYENYYVWKNGRENNKPPNNWISNFHGSAWKYSDIRKQWYLHQFSEGQPDLNYRDSKLVQEMKDVLTYWLDLGVDGFRVDIISAMFEDSEFPDEPLSNIPGASPNDYNYLVHPYTNDQPETYDMVYQWRELLDRYQQVHGGDARIMMTESYSASEKLFGYYGNETHNGAHFTFNFWFITELNRNSNAHDIKFIVDKWLREMPSRFTPNWVLGNHDQHRVASRYGTDRVDGLIMIAMMLPGVAVSYNGEEIGMEDGEVTWAEAEDPQACNGLEEDFYKNSRDFQRTPFQWDNTTNAGFNAGHKPWLPVGSKYATVNVAVEKLNKNSHYYVYKNMVELKRTSTLKHGDLKTIAYNDNVLGVIRSLNGNPIYTLLVNLRNTNEMVKLDKDSSHVVAVASQSMKNVGGCIKLIKLNQFYKLLLVFLLINAVYAELDWWQNAVVYQIYPRSFKDSDNNGTGDLGGVIEKLDYLVETGITALWLSPIYKSPQVDFGYDISDYREIDPLFGLRVVLDFVPNHSSDLHEWFVKSENLVPGFEDYYVWKDGDPNTPPNSWTSYFHGPAWSYSQKRKQWYLHQFASGQPDLNYHVLTYWMDIGVDGFRIDIISALFEDKDFPNGPEDQFFYRNDQPETYDMVYQWRALLDDYQKVHGGDTRVIMTESYSNADKLFPYYGNATHNGAHFTFNFWFITQLNKDSSANDFKSVIDKWYAEMPKKYTANWVLGNHDQHRVATRYGSQRVDGLNMLVMVLPGVSVTYNGEEIGMENGEVTWSEGWDPQGCNGNPEDWDKNSRDFERTPFHWDSSINAGFNTGFKTWLPVSTKYKTLNLAAQQTNDLKSHYRIYQALLKLKNTNTVKFGELKTFALSNILVVIRHLAEHSSVVVIINMVDSPANADLSTMGLPPLLTVKIPSVQSTKTPGSTIATNLIPLNGYEALVLQYP
ncbi:hypothetical protein RN001_011107 [Aquatica leii]|uniref:alpha-glucosidase n=1 Tax=Aquatica leii TaxID=1421715 RepID=A0AAN7PAW2_9COLE|nr:hypothetical protein RN001_011107 [Aquatica leii]